MVVVNVSPLLGLAAGRWGVADLLLFYAIENCLIVVTTVVRLLTYRGSGDGIMGGSAPDWMTGLAFAALIFGMLAGIFIFVGTVLAMVFGLRELEGSWPVWAFNLALLVVGHAVGLALFWFGQGQRWTVSGIASPILMALARAS